MAQLWTTAKKHKAALQWIVACCVVVALNAILLRVLYPRPLPVSDLTGVDVPKPIFAVRHAQQQDAVWLASEVAHVAGKLTFDFQLTNCSGRNADISSLGFTCGCLSLSVNGSPVHVGDVVNVGPSSDAQLTLASSTRVTHERRGGGNYAVELRLRSPPSAEQKMRLQASVDILPDLQFIPEVVPVEWPPVGDPGRTVRVRLRRVARAASEAALVPQVTLGGGDCTLERLSTTEPTSAVPPGLFAHEWECVIHLDPKPLLEPSSAHICPVSAMARDGDKYVSARATIHVRHKTGIEAPRRLVVVPTKQGAAVEKRLMLVARDGREFVVKKITCDISGVECTVESAAPSSTHWLRVDCRGWRDSQHGLIRIETDHPLSNVVPMELEIVKDHT